jgi:hypothetical protein
MIYNPEVSNLVTEICKIQGTKNFPNKDKIVMEKRLQLEEVRNKIRNLFKENEQNEVDIIKNIIDKSEEDCKYIYSVIFTEDFFKWKSDKIKELFKLGINNGEIYRICCLKPELDISQSYIDQIAKKAS